MGKKVVSGITLTLLLIGMLTLIFSIQSVSSELSLPIESPHPYPDNYDNTWTVTIAGAIQMRIHFSIIETESTYDRVNLYDKNDSWVGEYWGTVHDTWSRWVLGDTIKVRLTSDGSYSYFGFIIDETETREYIQTTPIALFRHMPVSPIFVNETIKFSAYGLSYDPDGNYIGGNLTAVEWDFGDGNVGTGYGVFHSYSQIGSYNVTLKVTDDDGETSSINKILNVSAVARNIALNPTRTGYPHPLESDNGWGGGADKWDIVDGDFIYPGEWARGLAFTGGKRPYVESAGWRQATINFGENKTFDRVRIWHHGKGHIPRVCKIQYWNGADWVDVFSTTSNAAQGRNESTSLGGFSWQTLADYWFNPVTSSKVRFTLDNHDIVHGWIWEFKVYEPVYYQLNVTSTPVTGITFTINGTLQTTPYTEWLFEGSYVLEMPEAHNGYVWSHWLEDRDTNRTKTLVIDTNITSTAVFMPDATPPTISIVSPENKTYPVKDVPLTFTVSEPTSWIGYSLDGQTNVTITGNTTLTNLLDGVHYVVVYANDTAGNMGSSSTVYFAVDTTPPNITNVSQTPLKNNVLPEDEVKVNATVTDDLSGVKQMTLNYTANNGTWFTVNMTNLEGNVWNATIPAFPYCTNVTYVIIAEDNANNTITTEEMAYEYQYHVIPEFPTWASILVIFVILTVAIAIYKRRLPKTPIR